MNQFSLINYYFNVYLLFKSFEIKLEIIFTLFHSL